MKGWREPSFEKIMNVGSAFAEYFERESRWRNDGREPSIPPTVSYIFSFPIPRSVFRFFPFVTTSSPSFSPPSLLYLFVSIPSSTPPPTSPFFPTSENSIVSLLFSSSTLPSSFLFRAFPSLVPLGRKIGEHTCQLPVVSLSSLAYVAQTASFLALDISSFSLSLFCPSSATLSLFSQSLFSFTPRFNGCTRVRSPRLREASSGLDWKAADFYPLLVFFYRYARSLCILFRLSPSLFCSITRVQKKRS